MYVIISCWLVPLHAPSVSWHWAFSIHSFSKQDQPHVHVESLLPLHQNSEKQVPATWKEPELWSSVLLLSSAQLCPLVVTKAPTATFTPGEFAPSVSLTFTLHCFPSLDSDCGSQLPCDHLVSPTALAACTRVDSCFAPWFVPSVGMSLQLSQLEIHLCHHLERLGTGTVLHQTPTYFTPWDSFDMVLSHNGHCSLEF